MNRQVEVQTPEHYEGDVGPAEFAEAQRLPFAEGSVVKYVCRWQRKGGLLDVLKAAEYLRRIAVRAGGLEALYEMRNHLQAFIRREELKRRAAQAVRDYDRPVEGASNR